MRSAASEPVATELPPYALRGPHPQARPSRGRRQGIRTSPHPVKSRLRYSAPGGGGGETGEQLPQDPHVVPGEVVDEALPELRRVGGLGVLEEPPAGTGDDRVDRPAVLPPGGPLDQSPRDQPVHETRHATGTEERRARQVAHTHP